MNANTHGAAPPLIFAEQSVRSLKGVCHSTPGPRGELALQSQSNDLDWNNINTDVLKMHDCLNMAGSRRL